MKVLKMLVSSEKAYRQVGRLFEEYWRQVGDLCVEVLRESAQAETIRMAVYLLLALLELSEGPQFADHLLNQGAHPLLEHRLDRLWQQRLSSEEAEQMAEIEFGMQ